MGYYTKHKIRIINNYSTKKNLRILLEELDKVSGYGPSFSIKGYIISDSGEGTKWYNVEEDMIKISQAFPFFKIQLICKGEEGEYWERIYKYGREWFQKYRYDVGEKFEYLEKKETDYIFNYRYRSRPRFRKRRGYFNYY